MDEASAFFSIFCYVCDEQICFTVSNKVAKMTTISGDLENVDYLSLLLFTGSLWPGVIVSGW